MVSLDPNKVLIPGYSTITITLKDSNDNPVSGHTIVISSDYQNSGDIITEPSSPTNSSGVTTGTISSAFVHDSIITIYDQTANATLFAKPLVSFRFP